MAAPNNNDAEKAFTQAYVRAGEMTPSGLLDGRDDAVGLKTMLQRHDDLKADGGIQCSVDVKASFWSASNATVDVTCKKGNELVQNPLGGPEQDTAREQGQAMRQQPGMGR